jgi:hypothetical protein
MTWPVTQGGGSLPHSVPQWPCRSACCSRRTALALRAEKLCSLARSAGKNSKSGSHMQLRNPRSVAVLTLTCFVCQGSEHRWFSNRCSCADGAAASDATHAPCAALVSVQTGHRCEDTSEWLVAVLTLACCVCQGSKHRWFSNRCAAVQLCSSDGAAASDATHAPCAALVSVQTEHRCEATSDWTWSLTAGGRTCGLTSALPQRS